MQDELTKRNIVCVAPGIGKKDRARTTSIYELFGVIADSQLKPPATLDEAKRVRDEVFSDDAGNDLTLSVRQAKALHDLLSFLPDESEDSGNGERANALRWHIEHYGRLPWGVVYYLLRLAGGNSYNKVSRKRARQSLKKHPQQVNRAAFTEWATKHIERGETPSKLSAIKRLDGFNKNWGTNPTLRKWWKAIPGASTLKAGAPRT